MLLKKFAWFIPFLLNKGDETEGGSQSHDDDLDDVFNEFDDDGQVDPDEEKPARRAKKTDVSKIVSRRLNEEREKLAQDLGYDSYGELKAARLKEKLEKETTLAYDDAEVQKVIEIAQQHDPHRDELEAELKQLREEKATLWEKEELIKLKAEYPELAKLKALNELDKKTIEFIEKGIEPVDAYFAANRAKILAARKEGGKDHLGGKEGGGKGDGKPTTITPEQLAIYRELNPGLSDEDIIERAAKLK